jgi:hypothetical protein
LRLVDRRIRSLSDIHPGRRQRTSRGTELELPPIHLPPIHLREEAYSPLGRTIFQRVRIAGRVLPGNLPKIHSRLLSYMLVNAAHPGLTIGCALPAVFRSPHLLIQMVNEGYIANTSLKGKGL